MPSCCRYVIGAKGRGQSQCFHSTKLTLLPKLPNESLQCSASCFLQPKAFKGDLSCWIVSMDSTGLSNFIDTNKTLFCRQNSSKEICIGLSWTIVCSCKNYFSLCLVTSYMVYHITKTCDVLHLKLHCVIEEQLHPLCPMSKEIPVWELDVY